MTTFTIHIDDSSLEKAFLSFLKTLDVKYKKSVTVKRDDGAYNRIIPAEETGSPTQLFEKWNNLNIDPKTLRKQAWRRDIV
ncbi:MAG: hypothetical protein KKA07_05285 [Bacteroidetes bacterium]|nr:hypothetical protein [Bacteroidota bacterium]MBU1718466.1 hypothetical protein [Bacteroidota bacterium]